MAAQIKYRLEAYSSKYRDVYRVDILEEGYTGAVTRKSIGGNKLRFNKNTGAVQHTSLTISIQSDSNFEYIGFFQYDNRRYPVRLYKNDVLIWSAYLVAESYSEPYQNPPYDVEIVATDGLGLLEDYTFSNGGMQSRLEAIIHCISNLGLELEYAIAVDFYEDSMNTARAMLDEAKFNGDIFEGEKCSDVLKKLLPFGTILTQQNNRWLIRRPFEDAEKTHHVYSAAGVYQETITGEAELSMGDVKNGGVWPHGMPLLTMEHAWQNAIIRKIYGRTDSFFKNYDFQRLKEYWTDPNDILRIYQIADLNYAQLIGYTAPGSNQYVSQSISVANSVNSGGAFYFEIKYDALGAQNSTALAVGSGITLTVEMMLRLYNGQQTYYLTTDGWTEKEEKLSFTFTSTVGSPVWKDLKIITNSIPIDGTMELRLYRIEKATSGNPRNRPRIAGVTFAAIKVYTADLAAYPDTEDVTVEIRDNAADSNGVIELMPVDLPAIQNARLFFDNGNYTGTTGAYELATLWSNNSDIALPLEKVIENQLLRYYGQPRHRLSGCVWRGEGLHLNAIAKHPINYNRVFVSDGGEWNILDDTFNINWVEIPGTATESPGDPWILEDGVWGDDGEIWKDGEGWEDVNQNLYEIEIDGLVAGEQINITSLTGIVSGDIITAVSFVEVIKPGSPDNLGDKLFSDTTEITSYPHEFTGTSLFFEVSSLHMVSFNTSFTVILSGVEKTVQLIITL
ncbi:MAG: hypothetical protein OEY01_11160 [Desulfobulbaceae bacterium]|nr:hypothetical protein [Desulfobulbaceae bacterium]